MNDRSSLAERVTPDISASGITQASEPPIVKMTIRGLNFYYAASRALHNIHFDISSNQITALIGPSGCGKSTFIRTLNRMYELVRHTRAEGEIALDNESIFSMDVSESQAAGWNGVSKNQPVS